MVGGGGVSSAEEIRAQALEVAAGWSAADAPGSWRLTAALFRAIAAHEELLSRLVMLPPGRLPALLASAAVSLLVRRDRPVPLAGYFPEPGGPQPEFDDGFYPAAQAFMSARLDDIVAACVAHRYQMNEVARCTQIALGISATTVSGDGPVALVDLGTGAGLGLQLDRYDYVVGGRRSGPQDAALTLRCQVRGSRKPPPVSLPRIAERVGVDASPVDLQDAAARSWLQSVRAAGGFRAGPPHRGYEGDPAISVRARRWRGAGRASGCPGSFPAGVQRDRGRRVPGRVLAAGGAGGAGANPGPGGPDPPRDLVVPGSPGPARARWA